MVESSYNEGYKVQFIKHMGNGDYVEYLIKISAPTPNISFHIQDRYSSMRSFSSDLKKTLNKKSYDGYPNFPPKKIFGNKSEQFLNQRMNSLQVFFANIFKDSSICNSDFVLNWFKR